MRSGRDDRVKRQALVASLAHRGLDGARDLPLGLPFADGRQHSGHHLLESSGRVAQDGHFGLILDYPRLFDDPLRRSQRDVEPPARDRFAPPFVTGDRNVRGLEADRGHADLRQAAYQRFFVARGNVPHAERGTRGWRSLQYAHRLLIAEIDQQVRGIARHDEDAGRAGVIRQVPDVGGRRDDQRIKIERLERFANARVPLRKRGCGRKRHRITDAAIDQTRWRSASARVVQARDQPRHVRPPRRLRLAQRRVRPAARAPP